ncbi:MAG: YqeG family HAD IIIA-type phosphatase [Ruminococcaceae bacterium]|nr:YqeG family HAD IIIA-type phosphatase [Oscillospiraceae bacterium]
MPFLQPNYTFLCYRDLTPAFLHAQGIKVLLLDIDNTLAPYEQLDPDDHIRAWLQNMADAGIKTALVSNNRAGRMTRFNATLQQPSRYSACKPLPFRGRKVMKKLGGTRKDTAIMGDQVFTDVLFARSMGIRAILVPPIKDKTNRITRLKRYFERGVLRRYYKRNPDAPDIRLGSPLTKEHVPPKEETYEK